MLEIAARNGRNASRTEAGLVQSALRQLRGPETDPLPAGPVRAELISSPPSPFEISFVTKYRVAAGKHVGPPRR